MKTKLIEDLEKEFPEQMQNGRNYQVTVEDLQKLFKILDEDVFDGDFEKNEVKMVVIDYIASIKWKGKFGLTKDKTPIPTIFIVKYSSDRFSHIVSVLCHEMIHLYDFKHNGLRRIYKECGDIDANIVQGEEYVHGYKAHGEFFRNWIAISKKSGIIVGIKYNVQAKELIKMSDTETELSKDTTCADAIFGKRPLNEDIDDPILKKRLEKFAKSIKGADVEFTYYDKDHWIIAFD